VLARVAEKAGWGETTPKDVGLGVATRFGQERDMPTSVACVARVQVDRNSGIREANACRRTGEGGAHMLTQFGTGDIDRHQAAAIDPIQMIGSNRSARAISGSQTAQQIDGGEARPCEPQHGASPDHRD
jgi:hypothetical protein